MRRQRSLPFAPYRWLLASGLALGLSLAWGNWDFALILRNAEQRYGQSVDGLQRIVDWGDMLADSANLSEQDKLAAVNRFFNRQLRFTDDQTIWRQNDYWATPIEALMQGAGDCEDYSIAKFFSLRQLGVDAQKLRIVYVKALRQNQAHMVLAYYPTPTADPLVLDNLIGQIRPASQRRDLLPVYAFNLEGLYLAGSDQPKGNTKQLSRWQNVLEKMQVEGFDVGGE
jgi:predicted transglutaminase-like cysteine proteinase